jgi:hypothetical protein
VFVAVCVWVLLFVFVRVHVCVCVCMHEFTTRVRALLSDSIVLALVAVCVRAAARSGHLRPIGLWYQKFYIMAMLTLCYLDSILALSNFVELLCACLLLTGRYISLYPR